MPRLEEIMMTVYGDQSERRRPCPSVQQPESELWYPFTYIVVCSLHAGSCFLLSMSIVYVLIGWLVYPLTRCPYMSVATSTRHSAHTAYL